MKRGMLADDLKCISLDRVEDILERDLSRRTEKFVASFGATDALNHISFAEAVEDLLGVGKIDSLTFGYLSRSDRDISVIFSEVKGA
jgi:hypothetical protein